MEAMRYHDDIYSNIYPIFLLKNIKATMSQLHTTKYIHHNIHYCKRSIYTIRQDRYNTIPHCQNTLKFVVVEHNVGSFGYELGLAGCIINKKYNKSTNAAGELEKFYDKYMARYITMACVIII